VNVLFRWVCAYSPTLLHCSHDWPNMITRYGDFNWLFNEKPFLRDQAERNQLGNPSAQVRRVDFVTLTLTLSLCRCSSTSCALRTISRRICTCASRRSSSTSRCTRTTPRRRARAMPTTRTRVPRRERSGLGGGLRPPCPRLVPLPTIYPPLQTTKFLALGKPTRQQFLEMVDVETEGDVETCDDRLRYDETWLAVLRATDHLWSFNQTVRARSPPAIFRACHAESISANGAIAQRRAIRLSADGRGDDGRAEHLRQRLPSAAQLSTHGFAFA